MSLSDYTQVKKLGEGSSGIVYSAQDHNRQDVAIKIFKIKEQNNKLHENRLKHSATEKRWRLKSV